MRKPLAAAAFAAWALTALIPLSTALAANEPPCGTSRFTPNGLYVLVHSPNPTVDCWKQIPTQSQSIIDTAAFEQKFSSIVAPVGPPILGGINAKYIVSPYGSYQESALSIQSRDLVIDERFRNYSKFVTDPVVSLYRASVNTICNGNPSSFIRDTSVIFSSRVDLFQSTLSDYTNYHNRTTEVIFNRGAFRDFHFAYWQQTDPRGKRIVCIRTDTIQNGNRGSYQFSDLRTAQFAPPPDNLLVAILTSLFGTSPSQAAPEDRYKYSNLRSYNLWFSKAASPRLTEVDFTLYPRQPLQIISITNLEARDGGRPAAPQYFLIRWQSP